MANIRLGAFTAFLASVLSGAVAALAAFFLILMALEDSSEFDPLGALFAFMYVLFIAPSIIALELLVFVIPITSFCKHYRTRRWFACLLVFWALQVRELLHSHGGLSSLLFEVSPGPVSALCWWLTSRRRWADTPGSVRLLHGLELKQLVALLVSWWQGISRCLSSMWRNATEKRFSNATSRKAEIQILSVAGSFSASVLGGAVAALAPILFTVIYEHGAQIRLESLPLYVLEIPRFMLGIAMIFLPALIVSAPVIVTGLLVFVVPVTSYFADYRTRPRFAFPLVCWAALVGFSMIAIPFSFSARDYGSALFGAWCGGISALCWWFTSRGRWADIARRASPTSSPQSESAPQPASHPAAQSKT